MGFGAASLVKARSPQSKHSVTASENSIMLLFFVGYFAKITFLLLKKTIYWMKHGLENFN